jgi:hypothetical protein
LRRDQSNDVTEDPVEVFHNIPDDTRVELSADSEQLSSQLGAWVVAVESPPRADVIRQRPLAGRQLIE